MGIKVQLLRLMHHLDFNVFKNPIIITNRPTNNGALLYGVYPVCAFFEAHSPDHRGLGCFASLRSEQEGTALLRPEQAYLLFVFSNFCSIFY